MEWMRSLAKALFLGASCLMIVISVMWALNGELAQALYDGILALIGLLAYLILRVGDLAYMLDLWLERFDIVDYEEWEDEDEEEDRRG